MKVLVTGITGFAGSHLVDYILAEKKGVEIVGIQRWRSRTENVEHFLDKVRMVECDLRDASSVRDVLDEERPEWIFHLAAQSFVPTSWTAPTALPLGHTYRWWVRAMTNSGTISDWSNAASFTILLSIPFA